MPAPETVRFPSDRLTTLSIRELITTDLARGADFIAPTPFLIVHGRTDLYCTPRERPVGLRAGR